MTTETKIKNAMKMNDSLFCSEKATDLATMLELLSEEFVFNTMTRVLLEGTKVFAADQLGYIKDNKSVKKIGTIKVAAVEVSQVFNAFGMHYELNVYL